MKDLSKEALISVICSVVSIFIFWWLSCVGIGLGIRALRNIKNTNEKGKVLAIIGIVIGVIALGLYFYGMMKIEGLI